MRTEYLLSYDELYSKAVEYYEADKYSDALPLFQSAYELKNDNVCLSQIGFCYMMLEDVFQANSIFQKIKNENEDKDYSYTNLGIFQLCLGNYARSQEYFLDALKRNDRNERAQRGIGECYIEMHKFTDAIPYLENSLSIDYEIPESHMALAKCYFLINDYYKSFYHFDWCLRYGYEQYECCYYLGLLFKNFKSYDLALKMLKNSIKQKAVPPRYYFHLAYCYFYMAEYGSALEYINKFLDYHDDEDMRGAELKRDICNKIDTATG